VTAPPDPIAIGYLIGAALRRADESRPRSAQKAAGILGPSDMGFCRERARLVAKGTAPSDVTNGWASMLGNVIGTMVEDAIADTFPDWILGNKQGIRVTATLRNGAEISGTPDLIVPEWNAVLDIKTKDGFAMVKREPWSDSYRFQTWCYVRGAVEAGVLDGTAPLYQGLIFVDRSGKIADPYVVVQELDPQIEDEINLWVEDVIYALTHDEPASLDVAAPVCEQICEFFTVCRGALPMREADQITDPAMVDAVRAYVEGRDMTKEGARLKEEATELLAGVNGTTGEYDVRWVKVGSSFIPAREREGYLRLDVRKTRRR
jgi:hypothetical protein